MRHPPNREARRARPTGRRRGASGRRAWPQTSGIPDARGVHQDVEERGAPDSPLRHPLRERVMDAEHFETLLRSLAAPSRRGLLAALTSGWLAVLSLARRGEEAAAKKKKGKRKHKQPSPPPVTCTPNCTDRTCGNDGCGGSCGECAADQPCQGGICCTPELLAATCVGRCGTWPNNCGQPVSCPTCLGDQRCLSNGSCATVCTPDSCPMHCLACSPVNTEGQRLCVDAGIGCALRPPCTSTADCPPGSHCQACGGAMYCVTLCTA
jgi:hypothetical protein